MSCLTLFIRVSFSISISPLLREYSYIVTEILLTNLGIYVVDEKEMDVYSNLPPE